MAHIGSHGRVICSNCGSPMRLWKIKDHVGDDKRTVVYTCSLPCDGRATFGLSVRPTGAGILHVVREAHHRAPEHEHRVGGKERHHAAFMQVPRSRGLARSGP